MIPTPKYEIGQTVWWATTTTTQDTLPCPDCLGKREWKITAPSGDEYTIDCPRCARLFGHHSNSLSVYSETPLVQELTVGSMRMDTNSSDDVFSYMCNETGVGSGQVYGESTLSDDRDTAFARAAILAFDRETAKNEHPGYNINKEFKDYTLTGVLVEQEKKKSRQLLKHVRDGQDKIFALLSTDFSTTAALYDKVCDIVEEYAA